MIIKELKVGDLAEEVGNVVSGEEEEEKPCVVVTTGEGDGGSVIGDWDAKRVLVGAGARALFYPTLLYNVVRNKVQTEFHWWDRVGEFILLGAVPFPTDVPRLKALGVQGVITLNEPYETLVPTSLYHAFCIDHLVISTRDYCFAPSLSNICCAVDFIHENVLRGKTTYVHCKAGRGRSTTIVLCYLVEHMQMTPDAAYHYVKSIRPRVLLASAQWQAVQDYYHLKVKINGVHLNMSDMIFRAPCPAPSQNHVRFDDGSVVVVTKADVDGYDTSLESGVVSNEIWADLSVVYRVRIIGQSALARISCMWLRCRTRQKVFEEQPGRKSTCQKVFEEQPGRKSTCSVTADRLGAITVDIHVF